MPLWIIPDRKLSVHDVEMGMRDHYEGTALALDTTNVGGGIYQMPYRPTPLQFKVDGKTYFNERPISTQQTALPREIGGVIWFGDDDANMVAYTPVYCGNTVQPECYNTPGADAVTFSDKNAFWVCNWVSNMVYPRYSQIFPELQTLRDSREASYFAQQADFEKKAMNLYATDKQAALRMLNDYSVEKAQQMLAQWKNLAIRIIVKYNDMGVKQEKNGKIIQKTMRPGYPESFARKLVKETGDWYAVPENK